MPSKKKGYLKGYTDEKRGRKKRVSIWMGRVVYLKDKNKGKIIKHEEGTPFALIERVDGTRKTLMVSDITHWKRPDGSWERYGCEF